MIAGDHLHRSKADLQPKAFLMRAILRMHRNGWLKRISKGADRTLGEALHVRLAPGERPRDGLPPYSVQGSRPCHASAWSRARTARVNAGRK